MTDIGAPVTHSKHLDCDKDIPVSALRTRQLLNSFEGAQKMIHEYFILLPHLWTCKLPISF